MSIIFVFLVTIVTVIQIVTTIQMSHLGLGATLANKTALQPEHLH